jgi:hypothetical protein
MTADWAINDHDRPHGSVEARRWIFVSFENVRLLATAFAGNCLAAHVSFDLTRRHSAIESRERCAEQSASELIRNDRTPRQIAATATVASVGAIFAHLPRYPKFVGPGN